jgi:predicted transposase YdaD
MSKPYDNALKRLMALCPQDFLNWLISGAFSTGQRSQEFESVTIEADTMHETLFCEQPMLFHVEFQSGPDPEMEQRLLEYSVLSWRRYKCTASTFVIYLRKGGELPIRPSSGRGPMAKRSSVSISM